MVGRRKPGAGARAASSAQKQRRLSRCEEKRASAHTAPLLLLRAPSLPASPLPDARKRACVCTLWFAQGATAVAPCVRDSSQATLVARLAGCPLRTPLRPPLSAGASPTARS